MSEPDRLEINWFNALGGALAAVSAAVVLSTLGTAGTLIGAALGSLCITVGGAVYSHSMKVAHERLLAKRAMLARVSANRGSATRALELAEQEEAAAKPSRVQMLRDLPWKRILAVSAVVFAIAMAAIVVFELTTGRPVSSYTGGSDSSSGTSVPGIGGRDRGPTEPTPTPEEPSQSPGEQSEQPQEEQQQEDPLLPPEEDPTPFEETAEPSPTSSPTTSESTEP